MKPLVRHPIAATAAFFALAMPLLAQVKDYHEIKTPPLRSFSPQQPKRVELGNGMVLFLQEDHELPLIRGTAHIRGGSREVPAVKSGLLGIYGQAWRTGGSESKTGDQLDDFLESRAARVETGGDIDSTSISIDVLKSDFDTVFPIFLELLYKPAFRQEKIDLAKTQARTAISRRNDEPLGIVGREATKLGYGADSPYARQPEYETIASVTRDDLLAFHQQYVHPNNIIFGIVGDFDSAKMEKKLRDAFGSWKRGPHAPATPAGGTPAKPGTYFVAKEDVTQANIAIVHPGGPLRSDPDYHAIAVMNEILSGGFSGRLMNHIRSQMGLAYGVGGGLGTEWDHPGLFRLGMGTKSESTMRSIEALKSEISDLITKPFTDEELALAKESLLNAFVFTMDSKGKVLSQRVLLEFYGYPADFFERYPAGIQKVTAGDVARVAKKYVHPDQIALLVVGKEKDFEKPMSSLGTVTAVDITIPEPGAPKKGEKAAPAASNAEGAALVKKVREFVGGKAKIDAVQATRTLMTVTAKTPQGEMEIESESTVLFPDSQRRVMKTPMGEMTQVVTPAAAFMITPMGTQEMPGSIRDGTRSDMRLETLSVLKNADNPGYVFALAGTEKIGDVSAQVLEITIDGSKLKWWIDPASGKILRTARQGRMGEQIADLTEWKQFGGLNLPTAFTIMVNGEKSGSGQVKSVQINPAIDAKSFEKPEK